MLSKKIKCSGCEYTGEATMNMPGIVLWIIGLVLVVMSFAFWPLFLVWPVLIIFLILYPIGQVCPECGSAASSSRKEQ